MPNRINIPLDRAVVEEDPDAEFLVTGKDMMTYIEAVEELEEMSRAWPYDGIALERFDFSPEMAQELQRTS